MSITQNELFEAEMKKQKLSLTQKEINKMSVVEYKEWSQKYNTLFKHFFPQGCVIIPRQKSQEEMKKEAREMFCFRVQTAMEDTLELMKGADEEGYIDAFVELLRPK